MSFLSTAIALPLAATMGYAIQRGATCTVAAVDEVLSKRRARRLLALLEGAVWVLAGLLLGQALALMPPMPAGYAVSAWTVLGAALLGLGAAVNRACVFGAVARFGSGEWSYAATPIGFFLGCVLGQIPLAHSPPRPLSESALAFQAPATLAWLLGAWIAWRLLKLFSTRPDVASTPGRALLARVWQPHAATLVIAVTFFFMLYLVGPWAYTDVLSDWARGARGDTGGRTLLLLGLLGGASLGGWSAGRFRSTRIRGSDALRCLGGGALMGLGSVLIPGGNDGLILTGMPLLWPHAWVSFAVMCLTIAAYLGLTRPRQAS